MRLGAAIPDFPADTTQGPIRFHDWLGDSWCVLFAHPADFTPVCTTELGKMAAYDRDFRARGVKLLALSCNNLRDHSWWLDDIRTYCLDMPEEFPYPIISDERRELAVLLDMVDEEGSRDPETALAVRSLYVIGPDRRLKLCMLYPNCTGRDVDEILRVVDSLQLTSRLKGVGTPADWTPGARVLVLPEVDDEDLPALFPGGVDTVALPSGRNYLRTAADPCCHAHYLVPRGPPPL
ncbi:peroxiredoxin-6-like [Bacillus rossius redtenbacheri]|uniref:peroxiredoxin-6-like n=1 Tax=Bacillus rossius redtenbacheri TaxID=93214 RepID=UPI002FDE203C